MPRVTIIGLGHMGLPTGLLLARDSDHEVIGYDISQPTLETLTRGELPFSEPGLEALFAEVRPAFRVTSQLESSDVFIVAVPTPLRPDRSCDLGAVTSAMRALREVVRGDELIVLESAVPPGTTRALAEDLERETDLSFDFAYVSEKAIPGDTLREMVKNDRIIGVTGERARERTTALYEAFVVGDLVFTDPTSAEAAKLFESTFCDVNVALANELSEIADHLGLDVYEVVGLANRHPCVAIPSPGPGAGGHRTAADTWFLVQSVPDARLIRAGREINDARPGRVVARLRQELPDTDSKVTVLGAAYKADVGDARESPAFEVVSGLSELGYRVSLHDPHVRRDGVEPNLATALRGADAVVLITDHREYAGLDLAAHLDPGAVVLDTRGLWRGRDFGAQGLRYALLGAARAT